MTHIDTDIIDAIEAGEIFPTCNQPCMFRDAVYCQHDLHMITPNDKKCAFYECSRKPWLVAISGGIEPVFTREYKRRVVK
jgi:hypothetical protein